MVQSNCILFALCSLMHTYEQVQVSKMDQIEIVAKARCTVNGVGLIFSPNLDILDLLLYGRSFIA